MAKRRLSPIRPALLWLAEHWYWFDRVTAWHEERKEARKLRRYLAKKHLHEDRTDPPVA